MATGAPVATIKKGWELKDSGHGVVCPIRRPIAEEPTVEAMARTASRRQLEAKERDRCANFASKAVAVGLAERTVRIAERQGQLIVEMGRRHCGKLIFRRSRRRRARQRWRDKHGR
jgi:hypothetical protein